MDNHTDSNRVPYFETKVNTQMYKNWPFSQQIVIEWTPMTPLHIYSKNESSKY